MHELSIVQSVLSLVEKHIPPDHKGMVTAVRLQIGELSGIELEALKFAFDIARKNGRTDEAILEIDFVHGKAFCPDCKIKFSKPAHFTPCPQCGNYFTDLLAGREMKLLSFEME